MLVHEIILVDFKSVDFKSVNCHKIVNSPNPNFTNIPISQLPVPLPNTHTLSHTDAAVPPWVGFNENEQMRAQMLELSAVRINKLGC